MADHAELIKELPDVEKLSPAERLKQAKKRRQQQLKKYHDSEKKHEKANKRKSKSDSVSQKQLSLKEFKQPKSKQRPIAFPSSVKLIEAAARGDIVEVRSLLEGGVDPDASNEDGLTALHQCCIDDSEDMLLLLLKFGANVNARDTELWTPLHASATCGNLRICQHLVAKQADLLAVNADGNMPYDICEHEQTLEYIETQMSNQGVTQDLIDETRVSTEKKIISDVMAFEQEGFTPSQWSDRTGASFLHIAAANGYENLTRYLLTKSVDVNARDLDGWSAAHAAACWAQLPVLEQLAKNGADLEETTKEGKSILDLADDGEVKSQIEQIRKDVKNNLESFKRASSERRGRQHNRNSSVRRLSMREKHKMTVKDAQDEAMMFRNSINPSEDVIPGSMPTSPDTDTPVTNIDDIEIADSDNSATTNVTPPDLTPPEPQPTPPIPAKRTSHYSPSPAPRDSTQPGPTLQSAAIQPSRISATIQIGEDEGSRQETAPPTADNQGDNRPNNAAQDPSNDAQFTNGKTTPGPNGTGHWKPTGQSRPGTKGPILSATEPELQRFVSPDLEKNKKPKDCCLLS